MGVDEVAYKWDCGSCKIGVTSGMNSKLVVKLNGSPGIEMWIQECRAFRWAETSVHVLHCE